MKNTETSNSSVKTKLIKSLWCLLLLFSFTTAFSNNQKVEISCSEFDAQIYANGELMGTWKVTIIVKKNVTTVITIKKAGFVTDVFSILYGDGVSPEKKYYRILVKEGQTSNNQNSSAPKSKEDKLTELKQLYDKKLITQVEYEESKKKIINE